MEAAAVVFLWLLPLFLIGYVLWLLTRLAQTVERIEWHLTQLVRASDRTGNSPDG